MQRFLISLALAGALFGVIVAFGKPRDAEADVFDDTWIVCKTNPSLCVPSGKTAYHFAWQLFHFIDDTFDDTSYYEECLGEGCSTEEVDELHDQYYEETIGENGTFEEVTELSFHDYVSPRCVLRLGRRGYPRDTLSDADHRDVIEER